MRAQPQMLYSVERGWEVVVVPKCGEYRPGS